MIFTRPRKDTFALVVSEYNHVYTEGLLAAARETLSGCEQTVVRVPGAFEIPLQVQRLARTGKYSAILALGLIWQGRTAHAQEILRAVTDSLMRISLETDVPVIHEVLCIKNTSEAKERCLGKKLNRGREAAEAALKLVDLPHPERKS